MQQAQKSVDDLHKTIQTTAVPAEQQATLDDVSTHIEQFQEDPAAHHQTLRERLENALLELGAEHPTLAEGLRQAVYDLSNAGV